MNQLKNKGGVEYKILKLKIKTITKIMSEKEKALEMQAKIYEIQNNSLVKRIEELNNKLSILSDYKHNMVGRLAVIVFALGIVMFLLTYFKK